MRLTTEGVRQWVPLCEMLCVEVQLPFSGPEWRTQLSSTLPSESKSNCIELLLHTECINKETRPFVYSNSVEQQQTDLNCERESIKCEFYWTRTKSTKL